MARPTAYPLLRRAFPEGASRTIQKPACGTEMASPAHRSQDGTLGVPGGGYNGGTNDGQTGLDPPGFDTRKVNHDPIISSSVRPGPPPARRSWVLPRSRDPVGVAGLGPGDLNRELKLAQMQRYSASGTAPIPDLRRAAVASVATRTPVSAPAATRPSPCRRRICCPSSAGGGKSTRLRTEISASPTGQCCTRTAASRANAFGPRLRRIHDCVERARQVRAPAMLAASPRIITHVRAASRVGRRPFPRSGSASPSTACDPGSVRSVSGP